MNKDLIKDALIEMLEDGTIEFNTKYDGLILIEIDGHVVQTIKL